MKTKLTKKTKIAICVYIAAMLILYIVVEILPKVTDIFETTQILEPGNLKIYYETTGYFIKDEMVGIAGETGKVQYLTEEGTAVKKGYPLISVDPVKDDGDKEPRFTKYTDRLKGYDGISDAYDSPASGIFSLKIDGYEDYFVVEKMETIKREKVESLSYDQVDLERKSVIKGEPVYKISSDDVWYILCWVDKQTAATYTEGRSVILELPEGDVKAEVRTIKKEEDGCRVIFSLNVYYAAFCESRAETMNIVISDNEGLLVDNDCIIRKDGVQGVYVVNKNGDYIFTEIKIIASDEKQSVIEDVTFLDEEGYQQYTVDVYDEVLKHPESALEKEKAMEKKDGAGEEE